MRGVVVAWFLLFSWLRVSSVDGLIYPILAHRYAFDDAPGSTICEDTATDTAVARQNGTVHGSSSNIEIQVLYSVYSMYSVYSVYSVYECV